MKEQQQNRLLYVISVIFTLLSMFSLQFFVMPNTIVWSAHRILVLITDAQKPPLITHVEVSSGSRCLN